MADERLRVLWLVKGLGPGGAEMLLVSAARVADHGRFAYEAAYLLPWKSHLVPRLEAAGVKVHCLGVANVLVPTWFWRLRRLLVQGRYDVLHLHSPMVAGVARVVARTLPRRLRPAIVSTEHNTWWSYSRATRWANALLYRRDAHRWAVSDDVHHTIWPSHAEGVEVLVHGLVLGDVQEGLRHRAEVRRELGVTDDQVLVGTVANYRTQKGYPDLLAAAAEVCRQVPNARFCAVGQGPLEDEIRARHAELGLGDCFQLLGFREDVFAVLAACDVFALASLHEGFPIAVMESLAAGVPVVATAVGGVPDAIQDGVNGFIVQPGRPEELADRLIRICSDDELRARCAAAAHAGGQVYDICDAVARVEQVYAELAS